MDNKNRYTFVFNQEINNGLNIIISNITSNTYRI